MRLLRKICSFAAGITFMLVATAQPTQAALITFTTTGEFGSTGESFLTEGDQTITFVGVTETVDTSDPGWFGSFGTFFITSSGNQSTGGLSSETFTLTITQVAPPGNAAFPATMTGQINFNSSNATVTFTSPLTHEISGFFYTVTTPEIDLPTPGGSVDIGGHVIGNGSGQQVPEPATLLLFGTGLGFAAYRNRRRVRA